MMPYAAPVITLQPLTQAVCPEGNVSFTIAATGATSYQWQVLESGSYKDIVDGGIYSNAQTPMLSLTGIPESMDGYQFRCVVSNGETTISQIVRLNVKPVTSISGMTTLACNGGNTGAINLSPSGGSGRYTYVWTPAVSLTNSATGLAAGAYKVVITDDKGCSIEKDFTLTQPSAITVAGPTGNVLCNGGNDGFIIAIASGGAPGYSYSWSSPTYPAWPGTGTTTPNAFTLAAGRYSLQITDAYGCVKKQDFTITQPAALSVITDSKNVTCNGKSDGTAEVTVSGGSGIYTYSWAPSGGTAAKASNLAPGMYVVTINDGNCSVTRSFTITEPAPMDAMVNKIDPTCSNSMNGLVSVNVKGATPQYTYLWTPSGNTTSSMPGLGAGQYTVRVTSPEGCVAERFVELVSPAPLVVKPYKSDVSCKGGKTGEAAVVVTGGSGTYTYSWSGGVGTGSTAYNLAAGDYTVTITDSKGCQATQAFTILDGVAMTVTASSTPTLCNGQANGTATVDVTGGEGGYSYAWSPIGGTNATATGLAAGLYTVTIKDENECETKAEVTVKEPAILEAKITATNPTAPGLTDGTATVSATGGTGAYTYLWPVSAATTQTVNNLGANTFSCMVTDANSCTVSTSITLKSAATINIPANNTFTYGDAPAVWPYTSNSSGAVSFSSNNTAVAVMEDGKVKVLKPGTATITVTQQEDATYGKTMVQTDITVLRKALLLTMNSTPVISKVYDGTTTATIQPANYSLTGVLPGADIDITGTAVYASKNQGTAVGITWEQLALKGASSAYYDLLLPSIATTGEILPRPLTVTATPARKVYGQNDPSTFAYTITQGALLPGDMFTGKAAREEGEGVKSYQITSGTLAAANYTLTFNPATFDITPAALLVTAEDKTMARGATLPALTYTFSGFVNNETAAVLKSAPQTSTTATSASPEGTYAIVVNGAAADNYVFQYQNATLTVTAAPVTKINFSPVPLYENMPAQTAAGSFQAEPSTNVYDYTLVSGEGDNDNNRFTIANGQLYTAAALDYESQSTYRIRVKAIAQSGLAVETAFTLQLLDVNEVPAIGAIADKALCFDAAVQTIAVTDISAGPEASQTTTLTVSVDKNIFSLLEIVGNGANAATIRYTLKENVAAMAKITVIVKDNGGIANGGVDQVSATFNLTVNAMPVFTISSNPAMPVKAQTPVVLTANGNATTYEWRMYNNTVESQAASITVAPTITTTYEVTGKSGECASMQTFMLEVQGVQEVPPVKVNNVITPNNDGYNDKWVIEHIDQYPDNEVKLFDKAGRLVYQRKGYRNEWDGTRNGNTLATGVYLYTITIKDKPVIKGYLTIVR